MKIIKRIPVPTGDICIVEGQLGKLEMLSIGDYGKDVNLKADFLGLSREPSPVVHSKLLPLEEKWVITVSTQYGCNSGCSFCDVPRVGQGVNATFHDLVGQVMTGLELHPEVKQAKRINLHYARMGEPTWNPAVIDSAIYLAGYFDKLGWGFHPVVSTMMPFWNEGLENFIRHWVDVKNTILGGEAGLQLSINATHILDRQVMFGDSQCAFWRMEQIMRKLTPVGRKFTLNFALGDWRIDPEILLANFPPDKFLCKLTPLHRTRTVNSKGLMPEGDWTQYAPYRATEEALKKAGYDVIVFLASREEDESRITCGNAILADREYPL